MHSVLCAKSPLLCLCHSSTHPPGPGGLPSLPPAGGGRLDPRGQLLVQQEVAVIPLPGQENLLTLSPGCRAGSWSAWSTAWSPASSSSCATPGTTPPCTGSLSRSVGSSAWWGREGQGLILNNRSLLTTEAFLKSKSQECFTSLISTGLERG